MKKEKAFLQKLDKIGSLTQVVCLSLFLTGVSAQYSFVEQRVPVGQRDRGRAHRHRPAAEHGRHRGREIGRAHV